MNKLPLLLGLAPLLIAAKPHEIAADVQQDSLRAIIERLVSFGTRHTLSSQTDPKRGIGAAVRWAEAEMKSYGLQTLQTCDTVTGRRVPTPTTTCRPRTSLSSPVSVRITRTT